MQEAPTLRPLGAGDIIDRVFGLFRERPLQFALIAAVPQLVFSIASRVAGFGDPQSFRDLTEALTPTPLGAAPDIPVEAALRVGAIVLVLALVAIVLFSMQAGALVEFAAARYLGRDVTVGEAWRRALRASPRLIGTGLLGFVALMALVILAFGVGGFFGLAGAVFISPILLPVGLFFAAVFAIVVAVFTSASWIVSPVVVMLENAGPIHALGRSWGLAGGSRWRILGLILLLSVLQAVLGVLFSLVFLVSFVADPIGRTLLQEAANVGVSVVASPLQWGTFTILYYDLRVRREAFDLELAAEQLPREA